MNSKFDAEQGLRRNANILAIAVRIQYARRTVSLKTISSAMLCGAFLSSAWAVNGGTGTGDALVQPCVQHLVNTELACGMGSVANGNNTTAIGKNSQATKVDSTASGANSNAGWDGSTATGASSQATNVKSTATGSYSKASGNNSTATGGSSKAEGAGSTATGVSSNAEGNSSTATGASSTANKTNSTATGYNSLATGENSTSIGAYSEASALDSIAIGKSSLATGVNSVAIGVGSNDGGNDNVVSIGTVGNERKIINVKDATLSSGSTDAVTGKQLYATNQSIASAQGTAAAALNAAGAAQSTANTALTAANAAQLTADGAVQLGQQNAVQIQAVVNGQLGVCTVNAGALQCSIQGHAAAKAQGTGAVAVGIGAQANGVGAMAQGAGAVAKFDGSVAIGAGAQANADPTTAVGNNAIANGNNSVALGANTTANGHNSVALGQGSVANRDNTVSVGSDAQQRQITNVAAGVQAFDAVNVLQLGLAVQDGISQANAYAARGVAQTLAMPSIPSGLQPGEQWIGGAAGSYANQGAIGLAYAYQITRQWNMGAGVSASTGGGGTSSTLGYKVQTGYRW